VVGSLPQRSIVASSMIVNVWQRMQGRVNYDRERRGVRHGTAIQKATA